VYRTLASRSERHPPALALPALRPPARWFENIPLLSWIVLRARCRCCAEPISVIYPALELLVGVLWAVCVHHYGPTFTALRLGLFLTLLLGVADHRSAALPHSRWLHDHRIDRDARRGAHGALPRRVGDLRRPFDALVGACAGAGLIAIVGWLGEAALGAKPWDG
jgi:leader peptidase (prepilin peptidase)/N-methyltransferase